MTLPQLTDPEQYLVKPGSKVSLRDRVTLNKGFPLSKDEAKTALRERVAEISRHQRQLFAERKRALLLIFQGMDSSGKDSTIRHVTTGVNPAGVQVHSFGIPSAEDFANSYLQRHWAQLPPMGLIGIHNRSHYEEVTVPRVHPDLLQRRGVGDIGRDDVFWDLRFEDIKSFEKHAVRQSRTSVLKFFLHISKKEQRDRLLKRLDDPRKNWKFDESDIEARKHWELYQWVYEQAIEATSTDDAPWYIVPGDYKPFARLVVAEVMLQTLIEIDSKFPLPAANIDAARRALLDS